MDVRADDEQELSTSLLEIARYLGEVRVLHRAMKTDLENNLQRMRIIERKLNTLQRRMRLPAEKDKGENHG